MKKRRNEKGSITLYVLVAMMLMCFVVIGVYMNASNRKANQMKELEKIKEEYERENNNIDEIYEEVSKNNTLIKYSNSGGEYAMPTEGKAKIGTTITVITGSDSIQINKIYYQWTDTTVTPTNWTSTIENGETVEKTDCTIGEYYLWVKAIDNTGEEIVGRSEKFKVREAKIIPNYNKEITKGPLEVNLEFDKILTKGHNAGKGTTINDAKTSANEVTVENNQGSIMVEENGYIYVEATDEMGNKVYITEKITNIDKEGPEIQIDPNGGEYELQYILI